MKKILKIIGIICIVSILTSCDDFLELVPPSTIVVDILYKSESDFDQALLGCYASLRSQYGNWWEVGDVRADDVWQQMMNQAARVLTDTYAGHTAADGIWNNGYSTIHFANTILIQIKDAEIANKEVYIAEAKFLRALSYFNIVRTFGAAPMLTEPALPDQAYKIGRTPVNTIYNEIIIPDFIVAAENLPVNYTGTSVGRATKGAAKALLGKVYLTVGDFIKAETVLQEITTMGYSLLDNYNDIFDWIGNKHHSEYIFEIEYSSNPNIPGSNFTNLWSPNWDIYRNHYKINGTLHDSFTPTQEFFDLFEEGDLRKSITVANGLTIDDVFYPIPTRLQSFFTLKYAIPVNADANSDGNWIVTRYSDVLLMLAEAKNENLKPDEALEYLNEVRERAGLDPLSDLSKSQIQDAIEKERRIELIGEGHRWFDLIRWGKALSETVN